MLLSTLAMSNLALRHIDLPPSDIAGPSGEPGRLEIVTELTGADPGSIALASGETFDLRAIVYDSGDDSILTGLTVSWVSSDTNVVTVDASGVVSYVGNGSATITASVTNGGGAPVQDVAAVTTTGPAAVNSLTVNHSTVGGIEAGSAVVTVTPLDASGNALAGRTVTQGTSDAGVCTASVSGYDVTLTFVAAGTANITLTCETKTVVVAVTVSVASAETPNEPAGFTQIHDTDFAGFTTTNPSVNGAAVQGLNRDATGTSGRAIITDIAPFAGETVLDIVFSANLAQGAGPEHLVQSPYFYLANTFTELYSKFWFCVPVGWKQPNGSTVQKLFHINGLSDANPTGGGESLVVPALTGTADSTTATVRLGLRFQKMSTVNGAAESFNGGTVVVVRGTWYKVEVYLKYNSGAAADGLAKMYLDGTQRYSASNLTYKNGGAKEWTKNYLNPTYGGQQGTTVGTVQHLYMRKWYTSGKA